MKDAKFHIPRKGHEIFQLKFNLSSWDRIITYVSNELAEYKNFWIQTQQFWNQVNGSGQWLRNWRKKLNSPEGCGKIFRYLEEKETAYKLIFGKQSST